MRWEPAKAPLVELRRELGLTGWHATEDAREAILRWYDDMENVVPANTTKHDTEA